MSNGNVKYTATAVVQVAAPAGKMTMADIRKFAQYANIMNIRDSDVVTLHTAKPLGYINDNPNNGFAYSSGDDTDHLTVNTSRTPE